eukprot:3976970-Prymnesium_polylepis.3
MTARAASATWQRTGTWRPCRARASEYACTQSMDASKNWGSGAFAGRVRYVRFTRGIPPGRRVGA